MLSELRGRLLRELSAKSSKVETLEEAAKLAINCLKDYELDLPFSLLSIYKENNTFELIESSRLAPGSSACSDSTNE